MKKDNDRLSPNVWSWALYDFANSAFTTLVVTFVYAAFFAKGIALDENAGTNLWSTGITISALIVAVLSPFVGAMADKGGYRKKYLGIATAVSVVATIVLFFPQKGDVYFALTVFIIANVAFEMANVFYNAFLPDIAPAHKIGRVSGYGWALGYIGGLLCLVVGLVLFVQPDPPLFGLNADTDAQYRATNLLVAVWFTLFSLPLFLFVKDKKVDNPPPTRQLIKEAKQDLIRVFADVKQYRQVFRLLVARLVYNDGLVTIFGFGGIYATVVFGFTLDEVIVFGIALNLAAGIGAWAMGHLDDKMGGKITILISLVGLSVATIVAVLAQSVFWFWVSGIGVGLLAGPNQAASRSLLGRFTPKKHENEFFGFFAFSGKFTAFLGPFLLGKLTIMFGNMRAGIAVVLVLFIVGAILLLRVDEKEGIAASGRA
ncbi:MAG: MFS transporter [Bacteroidetes Order II. Incertae sedis bacterium]|nr:MFS transporter [Bacteroidetes Order II. bacterium]MDG1753879.1 MFS transporter [Rhodothermales bacterium]MBT4053083.1 MFS transporter [Bacteroidetes Order II. bacterium]MBT4601758.1 MFS transporter [Bacteroidetes Order II. bacterium]MBT5248871.1 MFS transporter [Bacteroidetes Order II. bacterium]